MISELDSSLIVLAREGLYCPSGGFHIDPSRGVARALITHAHSDHARGGSQEYICARPGVGLLRERLGPKVNIRGVEYGEILTFGSTIVSFHPAGHVLGSAQIRVEGRREVWVASGDFKRDDDPSCAPFEVVACDTFITESTFANPAYEWEDPAQVCAAISAWWEECRAEGSTAVLFCYALGKAQRVLAELARHTAESDGREVLVSPEIEAMNRWYREEGVPLIRTRNVEEVDRSFSFRGQLLVTTPQYFSKASGALERLGRIRTAIASGWAKTGRFGGRNSHDRAFALSDHADWPALLKTVQETGAKSVYVLGEPTERLSRTLRQQGLFASRMVMSEQSLVSAVQGDLFGVARVE